MRDRTRDSGSRLRPIDGVSPQTRGLRPRIKRHRYSFEHPTAAAACLVIVTVLLAGCARSAGPSNTQSGIAPGNTQQATVPGNTQLGTVPGNTQLGTVPGGTQVDTSPTQQASAGSTSADGSIPAGDSPSAGHAGRSGQDETPSGLLTGNIGVRDQSGDGRTITIGAAEIDGSPGWVVISANDRGKPGRTLGLVHRADGQHDDIVSVPMRTPLRSGVYWATMHVDLGAAGRYEYPGPDVPLTAGNQLLSRLFQLKVG